MVVVFTPVHGRADLVARCCEAVDRAVPPPYLHLLVDDFSPEPEATRLRELAESAPQRRLVHTRDLGGTEAPNLGLALGWAWREAVRLEAEALLSVESDVVTRPGAVEAFGQAVIDGGERVGAVAPLYTEVGADIISTFGGMTDEPLDFAGHRRGEPITPILAAPVRYARLWWAHLACLWIPRHTLTREDVYPDPAFRLYYQDHDLCHQLRQRGREIVLCDHAVAEHTRQNASTGELWGETRGTVEAAAYAQLQRKWQGKYF